MHALGSEDDERKKRGLWWCCYVEKDDSSPFPCFFVSVHLFLLLFLRRGKFKCHKVCHKKRWKAKQTCQPIRKTDIKKRDGKVVVHVGKKKTEKKLSLPFVLCMQVGKISGFSKPDEKPDRCLLKKKKIIKQSRMSVYLTWTQTTTFIRGFKLSPSRWTYHLYFFLLSFLGWITAALVFPHFKHGHDLAMSILPDGTFSNFRASWTISELHTNRGSADFLSLEKWNVRSGRLYY